MSCSTAIKGPTSTPVTRRRRYWEPFQRVPALGPPPAGPDWRLPRLHAAPAAEILHARNTSSMPPLDVCRSGEGRSGYTGELKRQVLAGNGNRPDAYRVVQQLWDDAERSRPGADLLQKMTYHGAEATPCRAAPLMRVDKMTMATSVEARVPFLDRELVEFALALPPEMKVRDGIGKWLLKRAGRRPACRAISSTGGSRGFGAPVAEWFRADLGIRAQDEIKRVVTRPNVDCSTTRRIDETRGPLTAPAVANWGIPTLEPLQRQRLA